MTSSRQALRGICAFWWSREATVGFSSQHYLVGFRWPWPFVNGMWVYVYMRIPIPCSYSYSWASCFSSSCSFVALLFTCFTFYLSSFISFLCCSFLSSFFLPLLFFVFLCLILPFAYSHYFSSQSALFLLRFSFFSSPYFTSTFYDTFNFISFLFQFLFLFLVLVIVSLLFLAALVFSSVLS